ncbi:hypothetical protein [Clostridium sporogenes]|uniref:hypothetical protein n=1 Tax=Clostridium sporogenes TaxID=1509 RepID=UPI0006674DB6|nr:hypothetical protein [Clostridium sporogenes]NFT38916.1 hypothetical protein [Clostridium sporogenes]NFT53631.1 hypothetical protein [Clostridium sporogenes]NFT74047.1 hypothetical protein [Clostridium sporogenes]
MEWTLDRVKNISEDLARCLLNEFEPIKDTKTNNLELAKKLHKIGVITPKKGKNSFTDQEYINKWGSYIGIFTSNGIGYTEGAKDNLVLHITPIAMQLKNRDISYREFIIAILSRIQFPKPNGSGYTKDKIYDKPFIKILKVLYLLYQYDKKQAWIDNYDIVNYLEKSQYMCNYIQLYKDILKSRSKNEVRSGVPNRDILMNKCLESNFIIKDENKYCINEDEFKNIKKVIVDNQLEYFNEDKTRWFSYFGKEI